MKEELRRLNPEVIDQILSQGGAITNDLPLRETNTDVKLSMLIGGIQMATTETMIAATQQIVEMHIRGGGPTEKNPMQLSTAIADEVRVLQGQNLYN